MSEKYLSSGVAGYITTGARINWHYADFTSPAWHGELLKSRLAAAENGAVAFRPLDEVKQRLRRPTAP